MAYGFIPSTTGYGYKVLSGQAPVIPVTPKKEEPKKEEKKSTSSYTGANVSIGDEKYAPKKNNTTAKKNQTSTSSSTKSTKTTTSTSQNKQNTSNGFLGDAKSTAQKQKLEGDDTVKWIPTLSQMAEDDEDDPFLQGFNSIAKSKEVKAREEAEEDRRILTIGTANNKFDPFLEGSAFRFHMQKSARTDDGQLIRYEQRKKIKSPVIC